MLLSELPEHPRSTEQPLLKATGNAATHVVAR
jgi:hypothetical protein